MIDSIANISATSATHKTPSLQELTKLIAEVKYKQYFEPEPFKVEPFKVYYNYGCKTIPVGALVAIDEYQREPKLLFRTKLLQKAYTRKMRRRLRKKYLK